MLSTDRSLANLSKASWLSTVFANYAYVDFTLHKYNTTLVFTLYTEYEQKFRKTSPNAYFQYWLTMHMQTVHPCFRILTLFVLYTQSTDKRLVIIPKSFIVQYWFTTHILSVYSRVRILPVQQKQNADRSRVNLYQSFIV